jgi:deoxyribose-phosphate aldolase
LFSNDGVAVALTPAEKAAQKAARKKLRKGIKAKKIRPPGSRKVEKAARNADRATRKADIVDPTYVPKADKAARNAEDEGLMPTPKGVPDFTNEQTGKAGEFVLQVEDGVKDVSPVDGNNTGYEDLVVSDGR